MKKLIFAMCALAIVFFSSHASAFTGIAPDKNSGDVAIESNENIADNVATAGNNVYVRGNVDDDLFVAGNSVTIDGDVNGTLFAAGNTITINGKIAKDAMIAGNMIVLGEKGSIGRDLFVGGNTTTLNGPVGRNLYAGASTLTINNIIGGNVKANMSSVVLGDNSQIKGNVTYTSEKELNISSDKIDGTLQFNPMPEKTQTKTNNLTTLFTDWILGLLKFAFIGIVLVLLLPKWFEKLFDIQKNQTGKSLGIGFLVVLLAPMAILLLMITFIGIPFAMIVTALYLVLIYLTKIFVGYYLGKIINVKLSPILAMILGLLLIQVVFAIPFVSIIAKIFILILGLGSFYLSLTNKSLNK